MAMLVRTAMVWAPMAPMGFPRPLLSELCQHAVRWAVSQKKCNEPSTGSLRGQLAAEGRVGTASAFLVRSVARKILLANPDARQDRPVWTLESSQPSSLVRALGCSPSLAAGQPVGQLSCRVCHKAD